MEDFAEAFKDCVLHLYHNKEITRRDKQMMSIIKPIQRSGINELT
ncbi:hypothetical protein CHCC19466_1304 [Bacillus licheniformis]|nr:hypothetical protein CHCC20368_2634 [Bacillus licheniformis]TWL15846.1 hypothetical protein CHCC19466_1304 [Bacillus licheniformis]TWM05597.1 hypothetical protein CHCC15289_1859 [Bacillus licheniformis]